MVLKLKKNAFSIEDFLHWPQNRPVLSPQRFLLYCLSLVTRQMYMCVRFLAPFSSLVSSLYPFPSCSPSRSIGQLYFLPIILFVLCVRCGCMWSICKPWCSCGGQRPPLGVSPPPFCLVLRQVIFCYLILHT